MGSPYKYQSIWKTEDILANYYTQVSCNALFLKLNQTTPQSIINDAPIFVAGLDVGNNTTTIAKDGSHNLSFTDAVTGTKTLAELAAGITDHSALSNLDYASAGHTDFQTTLVSGTNIKTINSNSLLGAGDLAISASPGGADTQVQFNDGGAFGGDAGLTFDKTTKFLGIGNANAPEFYVDIQSDDATAKDLLRVKGVGPTITQTVYRNTTSGLAFSLFDLLGNRTVVTPTEERLMRLAVRGEMGSGATEPYIKMFGVSMANGVVPATWYDRFNFIVSRYGTIINADGASMTTYTTSTHPMLFVNRGEVLIGYDESTKTCPDKGLAVLGKAGFGEQTPTAVVHIKAGTATAGTAPLKLTTGVSNTTAELGSIEFTDPDIFFTITDTTVKRKAFVLDDGTRLTSGKMPIATTNGRLIDVTPQTELTDELTSITHTAPGTPDYAIQDLTDTGGFGFVTKDEGNTVLSVILNLQSRVNELETKLVALGLLADAD